MCNLNVIDILYTRHYTDNNFIILPFSPPAASGLIMIAELVSAVKRALSRMLLIIVAMGFGTVKPRLGDSLGKVVAIGVVYTILAVMDGIIRARNVSQSVFV